MEDAVGLLRRRSVRPPQNRKGAHMSPNLWPDVAPLLQARYVEQRRDWIASNPDIIAPWPQRRSRKRKPIPGLFEAATESEG